VKFLLDTNLISESFKPAPNHGVLAWLAATDEADTYLSVVTMAELRHGMERLPASRRRHQLEYWLEQNAPRRFYGRTLAVDELIADAWGRLMARRDAAGRPFAPLDGFLAATCVVHDLTLVTRNVADFEGSVEHIVNPWI
jgi:predicted nucleic acid-binding protein